MKRVVLSGLSIAGAAFLLLNFSCSKSSKDNTNTTTGTDSVLLNIGNNIILPNYQSLATSVNALDAAVIDFNASPTSAKLTNLQTQFKTAYTAWVSATACNYFGPAADMQPSITGIDIFPTTTALIDSNISQNNYNVNTFANTAAKGFPALDYLLFSTDNASLVTAFSTDAKAVSRQKYLAAVSADIKTEVNTVVTGWLSGGGNYINNFVTGTGNSVSSSLGLLINSLDQDFEISKNYRLGVPLGKIPVGSNFPVAPNEVEAYYSGISIQLLIAHLKTIQGIYLGTAANGNGKGLHTYLTQAEQSNNLKYNGGLLSDTITAHFNTVIADLQAIPTPLSAHLSDANTNAAFLECQRLVTLLKTDMPSDLGVLIFYGDNDGD
jgi:predicted lipoprotein